MPASADCHGFRRAAHHLPQIAASLALFALGCGADGHRVVIDVRSDLAPGFEAFAVVATLDDQRGEVGRFLRADDMLADPGVRVGELSVPDGAYVIDAVLRTADAELRRRALVSVAGADVAVTLTFTRDCIGVRCPGAADSPTATACLGGACVEEDCISGTEPSCPRTMLCEENSDCPSSSVQCAEPRCVTGLCLEAPLAERCGQNEYCAVGVGCLARPSLGAVDAAVDASSDGAADASVLDAGAVDGGAVDGGAVDGGVDPETTGFDDVGMADTAICVIRAGIVSCVGSEELLNYDGVPGPTRIGDFDDAESITCGARHCCVRRPSALTCFGNNGDGQLGDPMSDNFITDVPGIGAVSVLAASSYHSCALMTSGELWCWGRGDEGRLGFAGPPVSPPAASSVCRAE